jgi:hypothetical protein
MDGSVFLMFQQFFEMLPLVTIIQEQVSVLMSISNWPPRCEIGKAQQYFANLW